MEHIQKVRVVGRGNNVISDSGSGYLAWKKLIHWCVFFAAMDVAITSTAASYYLLN